MKFQNQNPSVRKKLCKGTIQLFNINRYFGQKKSVISGIGGLSPFSQTLLILEERGVCDLPLEDLILH